MYFGSVWGDKGNSGLKHLGKFEVAFGLAVDLHEPNGIHEGCIILVLTFMNLVLKDCFDCYITASSTRRKQDERDTGQIKRRES